MYLSSSINTPLDATDPNIFTAKTGSGNQRIRVLRG